jgi:hypothetical protein
MASYLAVHPCHATDIVMRYEQIACSRFIWILIAHPDDMVPPNSEVDIRLFLVPTLSLHGWALWWTRKGT